ncbi:MAG: HPr family phosphocarrier protein [Spirochaetaceae bacterium]
MRKIEIAVQNETGLHSRPADLFVRTAKLYTSEIMVHKGEKQANAKNIIKVILLNVTQGDTITLTAEGSDEEEALDDLGRLIDSNFQTVNERVQV